MTSSADVIKMTVRMTKERLEEFREVFKSFDENGDGQISREELTKIMVQLGQMSTEQEIDDIMKKADTDGSGFIEFEEFAAVMAEFMPDDEAQEHTREAFRLADEDGNGMISPTELKAVMLTMGVELSDERVSEIINELDMDGNGEIDYEEFVEMMRST